VGAIDNQGKGEAATNSLNERQFAPKVRMSISVFDGQASGTAQADHEMLSAKLE
jgi:hypothetical protein